MYIIIWMRKEKKFRQEHVGRCGPMWHYLCIPSASFPPLIFSSYGHGGQLSLTNKTEIPSFELLGVRRQIIAFSFVNPFSQDLF